MRAANQSTLPYENMRGEPPIKPCYKSSSSMVKELGEWGGRWASLWYRNASLNSSYGFEVETSKTSDSESFLHYSYTARIGFYTYLEIRAAPRRLVLLGEH